MRKVQFTTTASYYNKFDYQKIVLTDLLFLYNLFQTAQKL